jgi:hypothetical protein
MLVSIICEQERLLELSGIQVLPADCIKAVTF